MLWTITPDAGLLLSHTDGKRVNMKLWGNVACLRIKDEGNGDGMLIGKCEIESVSQKWCPMQQSLVIQNDYVKDVWLVGISCDSHTSVTFLCSQHLVFVTMSEGGRSGL